MLLQTNFVLGIVPRQLSLALEAGSLAISYRDEEQAPSVTYRLGDGVGPRHQDWL
jgi:hypothetical protein